MWAHFDAVMAEDPTPPLLLAFQLIVEEKMYNIDLLEQHRQAETQIYADKASEVALTALAAQT